MRVSQMNTLSWFPANTWMVFEQFFPCSHLLSFSWLTCASEGRSKLTSWMQIWAALFSWDPVTSGGRFWASFSSHLKWIISTSWTCSEDWIRLQGSPLCSVWHRSGALCSFSHVDQLRWGQGPSLSIFTYHSLLYQVFANTRCPLHPY